MTQMLNWWPAFAWAIFALLLLWSVRPMLHDEQWEKAYMSLVLLEFSPIVVINNTSLDKLIPGSILLLLLFFDLALWFATMRSLIVRTRRESGR